MKKTPVHGGVIERAQSAAVGVGQNSFGAEGFDNLPETTVNGIQRFIPANTRKTGEVGTREERILSQLRFSREGPFGRYPSERIKHPLRRVNAIQVLGHLGAEKTASGGMRRVALDLYRAPIFDGNQDAAGVGTVVRAGGMHHAFHNAIMSQPEVAAARGGG